MRRALLGCEIVVQLAALHPLVAPPEADEATYREANVVPFEALLAVSAELDVTRVILASSTSVWRDSSPGTPARFLDELVPPDADDPYARSKRECEDLLAAAPVALATERAPSGSVYAVSAPTPFVPEDASLLANDPRAAIRLRTGQDPSWVPDRIGSVVVAARIVRELGWRPARPSALMAVSR